MSTRRTTMDGPCCIPQAAREKPTARTSSYGGVLMRRSATRPPVNLFQISFKLPSRSARGSNARLSYWHTPRRAGHGVAGALCAKPTQTGCGWWWRSPTQQLSLSGGSRGSVRAVLLGGGRSTLRCGRVVPELRTRAEAASLQGENGSQSAGGGFDDVAAWFTAVYDEDAFRKILGFLKTQRGQSRQVFSASSTLQLMPTSRSFVLSPCAWLSAVP